MKRHPTAIIDPKAEIDDDVIIGPYCIIESPVRIASGTEIMAHSYICSHSEIGKNNVIHMGVILGHVPQHLGYKKCASFTRIGDRNVIREYVTIHRSWEEGKATEIGNDNFLMATSHVGHDCKIGNNVVMANGALLGGHVIVHDRAFLSGHSTFHQFVRIGKLAMVSGLSGTSKDIPPFCIALGRSQVSGVNVVGMRRAGIPQKTRTLIKNAFRILYRSGLNVSHAVDAIEKEIPECEEILYFVQFIKESKRGICSFYRDQDLEKDSEQE
ncbi:acyl-ACP--UDP-N-acetylglucosamine O-acyltransferase [Candidatus Sumerlaeota bacterium]|nr:acyl-ACP--UDP-N-acetylglucosamine O-acyltransferase [Candidatus Sumerlaeota bacterium]